MVAEVEVGVADGENEYGVEGVDVDGEIGWVIGGTGDGG